MKITTLIENDRLDGSSNLIPEWGLSLHIAYGDRSILFDTGKSGVFADNAERLNVDIGSVQVMALSHYHLDHGGGLKRFFDLNSKAKVYLANPPKGDCQIKIFNFFKKYVGLDKSMMSEYADRFVVASEPTEILPDVFIFPQILSRYPKPIGNKQLYVRHGRQMVRDDFSHEIVLAIKEKNALVIFTGCSHNGVLNMVETAARAFEGVPIKAVIGGFHLVSIPFNSMAGSKNEIETLGRSLLHYPIETTYTGHCTGAKAFNVLKSVMGDRLKGIKTGSCFEV